MQVHESMIYYTYAEHKLV